MSDDIKVATRQVEMLEKRYEAFRSRTADLELQIDTIVSALRLILPLAKGYAAEHPVGSNERYVIEAELLLGGFDISNRHRTDAVPEARPSGWSPESHLGALQDVVHKS